jgi:hypothetical protein
MTLWLGFSRERVSAPLQSSGQGSEALQYSAGDVEIHGFVQVFNQIITILSTPTVNFVEQWGFLWKMVLL